MRYIRWRQCRLALALAVLWLSGCSFFGNGAAYPSFRDEGGNVNSIELAWADGTGMGAFVDSTVAAKTDPGKSGPLRYRVRVVFDTGFTAIVVQDGSVPLTVGDRVEIKEGKVVLRLTEQTDPKRNLAHF
ncbi:MAG: hypothetical protein ABSF50_13750 [Burkholderiaceae bacterium]|jgi:hypothetical protein